MSNIHQLPPRKPEKKSREYKDTPGETNWGCLGISVYIVVMLGLIGYYIGLPIIKWIITVLR